MLYFKKGVQFNFSILVFQSTKGFSQVKFQLVIGGVELGHNEDGLEVYVIVFLGARAE